MMIIWLVLVEEPARFAKKMRSDVICCRIMETSLDDFVGLENRYKFSFGIRAPAQVHFRTTKEQRGFS